MKPLTHIRGVAARGDEMLVAFIVGYVSQSFRDESAAAADKLSKADGSHRNDKKLLTCPLVRLLTKIHLHFLFSPSSQVRSLGQSATCWASLCGQGIHHVERFSVHFGLPDHVLSGNHLHGYRIFSVKAVSSTCVSGDDLDHVLRHLPDGSHTARYLDRKGSNAGGCFDLEFCVM